MQANAKLRLQMLVQNGLFVVLLVAIGLAHDAAGLLDVFGCLRLTGQTEQASLQAQLRLLLGWRGHGDQAGA